MLLVQPLHHILVAIDLGRSSDPVVVAVGTRILPLYCQGTPHISWGWGVSRPDGLGVYRLDQPDAQELLIHELETTVLPQIAAINDIPSFEAHVLSHRNRHMFEFGDHISTAAALGQLDRAKSYCQKMRAKGHLDGPGGDAESTRSIARRRTLCDLIEADDRAGIIALLHQWEAATAADWGLAQFWQPSPFPIELM